MSKLKISKGYRKYIREEKARIKREVFDSKEQEGLIKQLYSGIKNFKNEKKSKNK